jgi:hypothetical protein
MFHFALTQMKKILFFISFAILYAMNVAAQQAIKANKIMGHIGEQVTVTDSIYGVKIYNDSVAVIDLGAKGMKAPLNVVYNSKMKFDAAFLKAFHDSKISVTGFVVLVADQPSIVITEKENLHFISNSINQKWLAVSQVPFKKN